MTTEQVLTKALELLGPNGENWVKEQQYGPCYCMVTAVQIAAGQSHAACLSKIPAYELLCIAAARDYGTLGMWNDHARRTWPEVKAAFERAIELARQEQQ